MVGGMKILRQVMEPGAALRSTREYLGITAQEMSQLIGVRADVLRKRESGIRPDDPDVRSRVERVASFTQDYVDDVVSVIRERGGQLPPEWSFESEQDMHAALPDTEGFPLRWWHHVLVRAANTYGNPSITP